ncbi:40S ribosomal protein S15-like [Schistocerca gregaria]|uniref:40S ribosomal protein S15-like n=1 Tax=Schistocerca gregaria TaxID=7010 RepID=UPI00211EB83F|nr:40S ribosomal protein S15-like [Schistocerca gregaria]
MAEAQPKAPVPHKRTFRKYTYRGVDLADLVSMSPEALLKLYPARVRRKFSRGTKKKEAILMRKLRKSKVGVNPDLGERPRRVKTHLRNAIVTPEMVGCIIGVHDGKDFTNVEIKADMIGHYLGEFSITYHPVLHGRPGIGATHSSRFIPLR